MKTFPRRGEVWLVNWNPARGSEQAGMRPALVIQNDIGNKKASTTIVAAISSSIKLFPMNVKVDPPEGGLNRPSIVKKIGKLGQANYKAISCVMDANRLSMLFLRSGSPLFRIKRSGRGAWLKNIRSFGVKGGRI